MITRGRCEMKATGLVRRPTEARALRNIERAHARTQVTRLLGRHTNGATVEAILRNPRRLAAVRALAGVTA